MNFGEILSGYNPFSDDFDPDLSGDNIIEGLKDAGGDILKNAGSEINLPDIPGVGSGASVGEIIENVSWYAKFLPDTEDIPGGETVAGAIETAKDVIASAPKNAPYLLAGVGILIAFLIFKKKRGK